MFRDSKNLKKAKNESFQAEIEHLNQTMQSFIMQHGLSPQVYKAQIHAQLPYQQVLGGNVSVETDQGWKSIHNKLTLLI